MIVFRIECEQGGGPYRGTETRELVSWIRDRACRDYGEEWEPHPMPGDDGIHGFYSRYSFGFKSYRQLRDWFFAPLKMIEDSGYFIAVYEDVEDVMVGGRQVAFVQTEKVTHLKPTEAYKQIRKNKAWNTATRLQ